MQVHSLSEGIWYLLLQVDGGLAEWPCGWVFPSLERHVELRLEVSCASWRCPG